MRSDMNRVLAGRRSRRGPAYRFLRSCVGRSWDAVFAEICAQCRGRHHRREEFLRHVEQRVECVEGELYGSGRHGVRMPIRSGEVYVCPATGLLRVTPERRRRRRQEEKPRYVRIDALHQCRTVNGVWHMVTLKRLPPDPRQSREQDVVLNRPVRDLTVELAVSHYGDRVFAAAARPMTERQLEQYKLTEAS